MSFERPLRTQTRAISARMRADASQMRLMLSRVLEHAQKSKAALPDTMTEQIDQVLRRAIKPSEAITQGSNKELATILARELQVISDELHGILAWSREHRAALPRNKIDGILAILRRRPAVVRSSTG